MSGGSRRTHCKFMPSAESRIPHVLHASPLSVRRRLISVSIIEKHDLAISASLKHSNSSINCTPRALANPSIATYPERMVRGSRYGVLTDSMSRIVSTLTGMPICSVRSAKVHCVKRRSRRRSRIFSARPRHGDLTGPVVGTARLAHVASDSTAVHPSSNMVRRASGSRRTVSHPSINSSKLRSTAAFPVFKPTSATRSLRRLVRVVAGFFSIRVPAAISACFSTALTAQTPSCSSSSAQFVIVRIARSSSRLRAKNHFVGSRHGRRKARGVAFGVYQEEFHPPHLVLPVVQLPQQTLQVHGLAGGASEPVEISDVGVHV